MVNRMLPNPTCLRRLLVIFLAISSTTVVGQEPEPAADLVIQKDIVYAKVGDRELSLDLARPASTDHPLPCIVVIHGGGWRQGNRQSQMKEVQWLARHGFVAATVTYRLAPQDPFPAAVQDVQAAVGYLRDHASEFHLDPQRFGAVGFSAGAHLAMMLGCVDDLMQDGQSPPPPKVQAVVSYFGPANLLSPVPQVVVPMLEGFMGGNREAAGENYRLASPIQHVDAADAPMLLFQGTADALVPWTQAVEMTEALTAAGVDGRVELLMGEGHGWSGPQRERTQAATLAFFREQLGSGE